MSSNVLSRTFPILAETVHLNTKALLVQVEDSESAHTENNKGHKIRHSRFQGETRAQKK